MKDWEREMDEDLEDIEENLPEHYLQFGDDWTKEVGKMTKSQIIGLYRKSAMKVVWMNGFIDLIEGTVDEQSNQNLNKLKHEIYKLEQENKRLTKQD